jgi:hypothetical protein
MMIPEPYEKNPIDEAKDAAKPFGPVCGKTIV